jgi:hypothetical protein
MSCKIAMPSYKPTKCNIESLPSGKYMFSLLCGYFISSGYIMNNNIYMYGNNILKTFFESFILDVFNNKSIYCNNESICFDSKDLLDVLTYMLDIKLNNDGTQVDVNFNNLLFWDSLMINNFIKGLFINKIITLDTEKSANQLYHILRTFGHCVNINSKSLELLNDYRYMYVDNKTNTTFLNILEIKETNLTPKGSSTRFMGTSISTEPSALGSTLSTIN